MKNNALLILAIIISVFTYMFWNLLPKGSFYIGNALFILLLSIIIFLNKKNIWSFILFSFSLNNLLDELFFNPTKLELNEILTAVAIIMFAIIKYVKW